MISHIKSEQFAKAEEVEGGDEGVQVTAKGRPSFDYKTTYKSSRFKDEKMSRGGGRGSSSSRGGARSYNADYVRKSSRTIYSDSFHHKRDSERDNTGVNLRIPTSNSTTKIYVPSNDTTRGPSATPNSEADCRISRTLRKLAREDDPGKFLPTVKMLQDLLLLPDNTSYIRQTHILLSNSLADLINQAPECCKQEVAIALGRLAHVVGPEMPSFIDWFFDTVKREGNVKSKALLVKALIETINQDKNAPVLGGFVKLFMSEFKSMLESTELPELLMAAVDVILAMIEKHPDSFQNYFRDTVDILVGWGLSENQPMSLNDFAVRSLSRLEGFWVNDIEFAESLLSQFLEDIERYVEDLQTALVVGVDLSTVIPPETSISLMISMLKIFNAVAKSVMCHIPEISKLLTYVNQAIGLCPDEQLIKTANVSVGIILPQIINNSSSSGLMILEYVATLSAVIFDLNESTIISVLQIIAKIVVDVGSQLPVQFVSTLLGPGCLLSTLKMSHSDCIQRNVQKIYHAFLSQPLCLQDTMWLLREELLPSVAILSGPDEPNADALSTAESCVCFYLGAISQSITSPNLFPESIFELLTECRPDSVIFAQRAPLLHYALLNVFYAFSAKYQHFVPALTKPEGNFHFSAIIHLLTLLLNQNLSTDSVRVLIDWSENILIECLPFLNMLIELGDFLNYILALIKNGKHMYDSDIVLRVAVCLRFLGGHYPNISDTNLLNSLVELCCYHANSTNKDVSEAYCKLLTEVPILHTLHLFGDNIALLKKPRIRLMHSHFTRGHHGFLSNRNFSTFMDYLLNGVIPDDPNWLTDMFLESYSLGSHTENPFHLLLKHTTMDNKIILLPWLCWEAAQLCVLNKLRTSLGKPPETFTSIEAGIKFSAKANKIDLTTLSRFRTLIDFMEYLEKAMYNAAEGTAGTLTSPPKNVRTFFHANKNTCSSWLTRVRLLLMSTGIHVSRVAAAVRHGHCFLAELVSSKSTSTADFELGVLYLAWAMLYLKESEAITGLYVWCKKDVDRHFPWLIPLSHHAAARFEIAAEGYKSFFASQNLQSLESKSGIHQTLIRFLNECLLDCLSKTNDFDELSVCLEKVSPILDSSVNGTHREHFFGIAHSQEEILFSKSIHEVFINSSCCCESVRNPTSIQALDKAIVECKISSTNSLMDDRCKKALNYLTDWSQMGMDNDKPRSSDIAEDVKNSIIKQCVFLSIGRNLERDALVLQMSENKIEIDLSVKKLLEKWGVTYDFEISNMLKDIKESYLSHKEEGTKNISELSSKINYLIIENLRGGGRIDQMQNLLLLSCACADFIDNKGRILSVKPSTDKRLPSRLLLDIAFWKSLVGQSDIKLNILKAARKESNFKLAKRSLTWHFKKVASTSDVDLIDISDDLMENFDRRALTAREGEICVEVAKLLYCTGAHESAIDFGSLTALKLIRPDNEEQVRRAGSRMLLTLSKWLQKSSNQQIIQTSISNLVKIPDAVLDELLTMPHDYVYEHKVIPDYEMAIGRILAMSVAHCPTLAKTWNQYASWCYRWGRKVVDVASKVEISLSEHDLVYIKALLPTGTSEADFGEIVRTLGRTRAASDEENIEAEHLTTSETIRNHLLNIPALSGANNELVNKLIDIWRDAQKRIYSAFHKAAQAYFKYLHLCTDHECDDGRTLTSTLRLLRLLVKHAVELQEVLEEELPRTPTRPWQVIIPQLFSRLNHPECYVRRALSDLLCRIAATPAAAHLITFPAVVGASACLPGRLTDIDTSTSRLLGTCLSQTSDEEGAGNGEGNNVADNDDDDDDDESAATDVRGSTLTNCFQAMVDSLSEKTPEAISQMETFVSELRRITVLWDELWLGTLNQHHTEINRRISQLEQEIRKVDNNHSLTDEEKKALIAEKHRIIMKPVVFILEQLQSITCVAPETPHEVWFQEKLGDAIIAALEKLKNPLNPRDPNESWAAFRTIHVKLQKRAQKRSCTLLKMENISPVLYALKDTEIAMPGISRQLSANITISSISNTIIVLPTKTKPKKLVFTSNTGVSYTYLFKGLEDLHLDERIMQFLNIANMMMSEKNRSNEYRARHYSVTPLGPQSGLISWVDRVTPLFTLYKKWQQRDALIKQSSNNPGYASVRPSELFYNKLTPLLKEAGVPIEHRKDWPLPLLKQVLLELMTETPKDLLAKELWCNSVNAEEWWLITKRYSRSVAVMSVIGYIIGLGDRHLDNVLIDLQTGEMVHIDYNVCFEKGKSLRVPEKVPFRLTQNIRAALGVTDIEGHFRLACEHVLKILKQGRETLLPLLEAFVYDPLIDWTPGSETGYTGAIYGGGEALKETRQNKKALEREVTKAMFIVRITEIKADWLDNREKVLQVMPQLVSDLKNYLSATQQVLQAQDNLTDAHQQMLLVKEAEAQGIKHPLFNLATRCALLLKARSARSSLQLILKEKRAECEKIISNYRGTTEVLADSLAKWVGHIDAPKVPDSYQTFDLVKEFLQTAGQNSMVLQCDQSERELGQQDDAQRQLIRTCVDLLGEYNALVALYPSSGENHRANRYVSWSDQLLSNMDITTCSRILDEFTSVYGSPPVKRGELFSKQVIAYMHALQNANAEAQVKLKKNLDRLANEKNVNDLLDVAVAKANEFSRSDPRAECALELALISTLCTINQRYLQMEVAAKGAEEGLEGLRLKEGHTWLEEMHLVSGVVSELASLLPVGNARSAIDDTAIKVGIISIKKTHAMFRELLDLNSNFNSIILPEALKRMQTEHPDMLSMLNDFQSVIKECGISLDELLNQLKLHLRAIIIDTKSSFSDSQQLVVQLGNGLESLLQKPCEDHSPGQMLLMGLNGLFDKLQAEARQMVSLLAQLPLPHAWRKLDQIREASMLTGLVMNEKTRTVCDDILLVRRIQSMHEVFAQAHAAGAAFRGHAPPLALDDERLNRPVRRYLAEFVSRVMLGAPSQALATTLCHYLLTRFGLDVTGEIEGRDVGADGKVLLEDLCKRAVEISLQKGLSTNHLITEAATHASTLHLLFRQRENRRLLTETTEACSIALTRLQITMTAHNWYHEDIIQEVFPSKLPVMHNRTTFMTKLSNARLAISTMQTKLTEVREAQRALIASVEQRLKWAAGANPALHDVLAAFAAAVAALDVRIDSDQMLASQIAAACTAVLRYEALRTRTHEATAHDEALLKVLQQAKETAGWLVDCKETVSPAEEGLLQLMTPEFANDPKRLLKLEKKITENIDKLKKLLGDSNSKVVECRSALDKQLDYLKSLFAHHHSLVQEVRHLLKSMARFEEMATSGVAQYLCKYAEFSECVTSVVKLLTSVDSQCIIPVSDLESAITILETLPDKIKGIYDELIGFADKGRKRPPLVRQESIHGSPKHMPADKGNNRGKAVQERNTYAINVWRRIQMKLEGRDPDAGRRSSHHEQVDFIIREATSLDNLALLYEGWTPWV